MSPTHITRFWGKVEKTDSCWLWTGGTVQGYGMFYVRLVRGQHSKSFMAHRIAYELIVGRIPVGLYIDHLCRNRKCVNPKHLEPVTNAENVMRGTGLGPINAQKTHCPHGHEYTPENIYWYKKENTRHCRTCALARERIKRQQRRQRPSIALL